MSCFSSYQRPWVEYHVLFFILSETMGGLWCFVLHPIKCYLWIRMFFLHPIKDYLWIRRLVPISWKTLLRLWGSSSPASVSVLMAFRPGREVYSH